MPGRKLFSNLSPYPLVVTLAIRKREDPRNQAGTKEFSLPPHAMYWEEFGNDVDIYLNGINLVATTDGGAVLKQEYVTIVRDSPLDKELNMFNAVDFNFANGVFQVSTRQVF